MKRFISVLLALIVIIGSFSICQLTAFASAKKDAPLRDIGDKFTLSLSVTKKRNVSTDWKHAYYAKIKPEKDCDYEFATSGLEIYDFVFYKALIVDAKDNVVSYAYALGEDSYCIDLVGHLKGGRTYYYLVQYYNDNYEAHSVKLTVKIKKHKHKMINTDTATPDAEHMIDAVDKNGKGIDTCKIQGCTDSGVSAYYKIYTAEPVHKRMTYNGKAREPSLRFRDMRGKVFTPNFTYKCRYTDNVRVGTAKIDYVIDGLWNTLKFQIVPKGTEITKVTPRSRGFKIKWKKQQKQTSGYQVQYSKYKNFKSPFKQTVKGNKKTSFTAKNLRSHRKYYIKIRTYKTVKGKKYYSKWSEVKTVKAK